MQKFGIFDRQNNLFKDLQILEDAKGKPTGIFIPISKWRELKKK